MPITPPMNAADSVVLIYPYWNVNQGFASYVRFSVKVLIYPYWNVNLSALSVLYAQLMVLIYPYWNVNDFYKEGRDYLKTF